MPFSAPSSPLDAAAIPGTGVVYVCGNNFMYIDTIHTSGAIFKTTDYGATWESQPAGQPSKLRAISFLDEHIGAAVGDAGTIITTRNGGVAPVSVRRDGQQPGHMLLHQNNPNPFNPSTTIKYVLPKSSMVRLSVFDMLGREVSVLANEREEAGVHEVKFDGSGLASGIYFYCLTAGSFVQTRKLLLLR